MFLLWSTFYYWFFMVYPIIFPLFWEPRAGASTLYHCTGAAQVYSHLSFFKLFTDTTVSEAGHEICSSSWPCDRNFFLISNFYLLKYLYILIFYIPVFLHFPSNSLFLGICLSVCGPFFPILEINNRLLLLLLLLLL